MYLPHHYQHLKPYNKHDKFFVVKVSNEAIVEGHVSEGRANRAMTILNEHNETHGHAERFKVLPVDKVSIP